MSVLQHTLFWNHWGEMTLHLASHWPLSLVQHMQTSNRMFSKCKLIWFYCLEWFYINQLRMYTHTRTRAHTRTHPPTPTPPHTHPPTHPHTPHPTPHTHPFNLYFLTIRVSFSMENPDPHFFIQYSHSVLHH